MTGADGEAIVTILNATFLTSDRSVKRYPDPDFGFWLISQIFDVHKFLAESRGLVKKKYYCPTCSTVLDVELRKPIETVYDLQFGDLHPITLRVTFPSVECPVCKKASGIDLKGPPGYQINEAILHAFETEKIKP